MKIIQINKFFDIRGGAEVYMHQLSLKLRERGHEVHCFATKSERDQASDDKKYFVKRFNFDKREGAVKDAIKALNFLWNREAAESLDRMIVEIKPDVIHLHNVYHHLSTSILRVIRKHDVPCVQTLHDYKLACPNYKMFTGGLPCERCKGGKYFEAVKHQCLFSGTMPNLLGALEMYMAKATQAYEKTVDTFICPSEFMLKKMVDFGEPEGKMVLLRNPIERRITNYELRITNVGRYFIYIGRLYGEKGVETIVKAVSRIEGAKLKIVGEGPEREKLEKLANEMAGERIEFLGFKSGDELEELRNGALAVLVPSIWYENAPLSVLEAMSAGKPVIASYIGGLTEMVIDGETGFLARAEHVDDWIDKIEKMAELSQEDREKMGARAIESCGERFGWEMHIKMLLEIYRKSIG